MKIDISIIAITLNEERNLQSFIDNIKKITNKIFIVDSLADWYKEFYTNKRIISFKQLKFYEEKIKKKI